MDFVIGSVSSIPTRLDSLIFVLDDMLKQTRKIDFLYVSIARYYPRSKTTYSQDKINELKTFLSSYPIPNELVIYENDIGPTVKLLTPLKHFVTNTLDSVLNRCKGDTTGKEGYRDNANTFIFTFDDDTPVQATTIEALLLSYNKNKGAAYSFSGAREGRFLHAELLPHDYDYFEIDVVGGYRGVLYPMSLFKDKLEFYRWVEMFMNDSKRHNLIAMHDDHIFSYYLKYKGIPRRVSNSPFNKDFTYTPIQNTDGIFNDENTHSSFDILKQTLFDNDLAWVFNNPY
jgi:hypothetical protein